ncbi:MAG: ATP-binding cassette domain-containing protein [Gemmataceae bacterium]|nr:ATP-binding cassette domain-containing protein [Gemmataceae bacterium]
MAEAAGWIRLRGARTHNLRNVDADLPRACLTVITGPSGSGKSSLAFDTLHAEGQRRYLETLRAGTRALFAQLPRPDIDQLEGLPPTVCISQRTTAPRPRSTLATVTEIHDHLRLLWARLGTPHCWQCGGPIRKHTVADIVRAAFTRGEGRKVFLLAPLVQDEAGGHRAAFQQIRQGGYLRARVDGVLQEIRDIPQLDPRGKHTIELVVDRLVVRAGLEERFTESIATAATLGEGRVLITDVDDGDWRDDLFSTVFACPRCRIALPDLEPRRFSFNNPYGACPACTGYGQVLDFDPETAAEDDEAKPERVREALAAFVPCPECGGARLNREARSVRFAGKGLHDVTALGVADALHWFDAIPKEDQADTALTRARDVLLAEITTRLRFLDAVGLGYLTLDRPAPTLSGGELQRARLATYLGGGLRGVCYILDEPTMGLHPRDTERLLHALRNLQERGNTVVVVEHDETVIRAADWLLDIGPGAGRDGGQLLAAGPAADVLANPQAVTGKWLAAARRAGGSPARLPLAPVIRAGEPPALTIRNARHHNLKSIDVAFPLGRFIAVSGVSGSGKSSLVRDTLAHAVRGHLGLQAPPPGAHDAVEGLEQIDKIIEVNQQPIGRTSRSCPATYTGLFDHLRQVFAATRTAKARGYKANRFSFNTRGGRCEECQGQGELKPDAHWLPDLRVPCPACRGRRFNPATLAILYRGQSIADVLDMTVAEAAAFFANLPALQRTLQPLGDVGLGYVALGQPANTLSGGEAQRVKLATELARAPAAYSATGRTLYLLDEPTTGLHISDVANLIRVLRQLVAAGNTVIVIEHHLDVIAAADWVIDLGPAAGDAGGRLVFAGPPSELASCGGSVTGRFLSKSGVHEE